eukprot:GEMP01075213.1.p1 GENE.GEMP01075213.1~~GEMP01075213.1.p1  ORF type:complete len:146 (+),score=21.92 GEMP01075213.1:212-649(+)
MTWVNVAWLLLTIVYMYTFDAVMAFLISQLPMNRKRRQQQQVVDSLNESLAVLKETSVGENRFVQIAKLKRKIISVEAAFVTMKEVPWTISEVCRLALWFCASSYCPLFKAFKLWPFPSFDIGPIILLFSVRTISWRLSCVNYSQ